MSERIISHYKVVVKHAQTGAVLRTVEPFKDRRFVYEYDWNAEDHGGQAARDFTFELYSVDDAGNVSEPQVLEAHNPPPPVPLGVELSQVAGSIRVSAVPDPTHRDISGLLIWLSDTSGFTPSQSNLKYAGPGTQASVNTEGAVGLHYVRVALYDSFGFDAYNISDEFSIELSVENIDSLVEMLDEARDRAFDALGIAKDELAAHLQTFQYASQLVSETSNVAALPSSLNWFENPYTPAGWQVSEGGVLLDLAGDPPSFLVSWDPSRFSDLSIWAPFKKRINPTQRAQFGVVVGAETQLEAVFYDKNDVELQVVLVDTGENRRLEGFATAPADTHWVKFRLKPINQGSENAKVSVVEPFAAYALPGQIEVRDFQPPDSEIVAQISELRRTIGKQAEFERVLSVESKRALASVYQNSQAIITEREARALLTTQLNSRIADIENDYLSEAEASSTYLTIASLSGSLAAYNLNLNATFAQFASSLSGTYLTQAAANQNFLAKADLNGAIGAYDFSALAYFNNLSASVSAQGIAIADLEGVTATHLTRVAAGSGEASIELTATDSNGQVASQINISAQTVTLGSNKQFRVNSNGYLQIKDNLGNDRLTFNPADSRLQIKNAAGVVQFDNLAGGVLYDGLPALATATAFESVSALSMDGTWKTAGSLTVSATNGSSSLILCSLTSQGFNNTSVGASVQARIKRGGTIIWSGTVGDLPGIQELQIYRNGMPVIDEYARYPGVMDQAAAFFDVDTPGAGTHTYTLEVTGPAAATVSNRRMVAFNFKKAA